MGPDESGRVLGREVNQTLDEFVCGSGRSVINPSGVLLPVHRVHLTFERVTKKVQWS